MVWLRVLCVSISTSSVTSNFLVPREKIERSTVYIRFSRRTSKGIRHIPERLHCLILKCQIGNEVKVHDSRNALLSKQGV